MPTPDAAIEIGVKALREREEVTTSLWEEIRRLPLPALRFMLATARTFSESLDDTDETDDG